jgi:thiol-disulfide isomerase/thioredoxin
MWIVQHDECTQESSFLKELLSYKCLNLYNRRVSSTVGDTIDVSRAGHLSKANPVFIFLAILFSLALGTAWSISLDQVVVTVHGGYPMCLKGADCAGLLEKTLSWPQPLRPAWVGMLGLSALCVLLFLPQTARVRKSESLLAIGGCIIGVGIFLFGFFGLKSWCPSCALVATSISLVAFLWGESGMGTKFSAPIVRGTLCSALAATMIAGTYNGFTKARMDLTKLDVNHRELDNISLAELLPPDSPRLTDGRGPIKLVVFSSFYCGSCAKTVPALKKATEGRSDLEVVYRYARLNKHSELEDAAALAAKHGKFWQFALKAWAFPELPSNDQIGDALASLGIAGAAVNFGKDRLLARDQVKRDEDLADRLEIRATPTVLIITSSDRIAVSAKQAIIELGRIKSATPGFSR